MKNNLILIAAVDRNWGIGNDNKLLKRIPEDLKRFSELTKIGRASCRERV